jgi:hypothetical protein
MTTKTAFALFILGLILTAFGVGGVENSVTDTELLSAVAVSALGLAIMYAGTIAMRVSDYYDPRG